MRVKIQGSEQIKFRPNVENIDPSSNFDYVPNNLRYEYNIENEEDKEKNVSLQIVQDEVEILPYEVYKMEIEKWKTISFWGWDSLKILRIHNSNLGDLYWEMFDGLEGLEHLSLEGNSIKNIPPFSFYGALNIKTLSLAHNSIMDLNYRALGGLLELELLDLSDNNLTQLSEMTFPPFPKLEIVDLRENPVKGIFPGTFGVMNNTKVLYVEYQNEKTDVDEEVPASFEFLQKLIFLDIEHIRVPSLNSLTFAGLKSLEILKIHGSVNSIEYDTFAQMTNLKDLNLSDCNIAKLSQDAFYGAKNLKIIDLSFNSLEELPDTLFYDQSILQEIYLQGNRLKDLPSIFFALKSIKLIRINQNPLKCYCGMKKWKSFITNSIPTIKRIPYENDEIYEFSYVFDNKLAPHCTSSDVVKPKPIYYALRKILKCANKENKKNIKEKVWKQHNQEQQMKMKEKAVIKELLKPKKKQKNAFNNYSMIDNNI